MSKNHRNFKFYDGNSGQVFHVKEVIDDGKTDIVADIQEIQDVLALMRWSDDGGKHSPKHWSF